MTIPTWDDLWGEAEEIEDKVIDTWRWGTVNESIFRDGGGRYWSVIYRSQPEEGVYKDSVEITEVKPITKTVTTTTYEKV